MSAKSTPLEDASRPPSATSRPLTLAIAEYDRTRPLIFGRVKPQGIVLDTTSHYNGDFCERPVYEQYDVAEMSFSWYVMARDRGEPVIALPIFPLRMPVLAYILVRKDSPDFTPQDLVGKRIGVASYRFTVNLWLRGILRDHYGVAPTDVTWVTCAESDAAGYEIPAEIKVEVNGSGSPAPTFQELLERPSLLLERGDVDAIIVPELPHSFLRGQSNFRRLFRNPRQECESYVARSGFLPITHILVMREALSRDEPWIGSSLLAAFTEAQRQCDEFIFSEPKNLSLPDSVFYLEQHRAAYAPGIWSHGLEPNRAAIDTFLRYAYEQRYTSRHFSAADIFPSNMR